MGRPHSYPSKQERNSLSERHKTQIQPQPTIKQRTKRTSQRGTRRRFYQVGHACQWQVRELTYSSLNSPLRMAQSRLKTQNRPQILSFSARRAPSALQTTRETPNDPQEISHREHGEERQKGSEIPQHQRRPEQPEQSEKTRSTQNEKSHHANHEQKREISRHAQLP